MKTTNNVQKAITKSLAVIISLVLISITVNAQDFWRTVLENNSFSQIAMAMVDQSEAGLPSADGYYTNEMTAYAEYANVEAEESLDVENWMTNENSFFTTITVETATESALEVEAWMTDENRFNTMATYLSVETEDALEVEDWMYNTDFFGVTTVEVEEATETKLQVEAWMTNAEIWEM
ncbi:hypothetical protein [uncultured Draconibacterium sp.]|uniref:hypothetical protein n=1 Tax=uncultured Draconibacterium sp. TaxID=1573823 RepID=UPI00326125DD